MAFSHGTNDAQKTMGIITLSLVISGYLSKFSVPYWVIGLSATAIALGTALGGWRLIRTLGGKFYKIRPVDAFTTQLASTIVILGASLVGGPVSELRRGAENEGDTPARRWGVFCIRGGPRRCRSGAEGTGRKLVAGRRSAVVRSMIWVLSSRVRHLEHFAQRPKLPPPCHPPHTSGS